MDLDRQCVSEKRFVYFAECIYNYIYTLPR